MIALEDIKDQLLANDRENAIPLWDEICNSSEDDPDLADALFEWIDMLQSGVGGTVHLRDNICMRFKDDEHLFEEPNVEWKRRYPFDDAWMAIDSAGLAVRLTHEQGLTRPGM